MIKYFSISKFILYLTPFTAIIFTPSVHFPYILGKYAFFRGMVGLSLIAFFLGIIFSSKSDKYWNRLLESIKSPLGIVIGIFTFIFTLAGILGIDPIHSFFSNFERGEGSLQIIFLYAFFILLSTFFTKEKDWKSYFTVFIVSAVLSIFYGLASGLGLAPGTGQSLGEINRFAGSLGNPSYFATFMLFSLFFSTYLLSSKELEVKKKKKIWLIASIILFIGFFLWAATRGAFLGLIGAAIVGAIYLFIIKKDWRKPITIIAIIGAIIIGGGYIYKDSNLVESLPIDRLYDLSIEVDNFQERLIMWNISIEAVKDRPLLGFGPESFNRIFLEYYNPNYYNPAEKGFGNYGPWFDRAHSTTFDYLTQSGILGLLSYWAIFALFITLFIKSKIYRKEPPLLSVLILILPVAYLIQGQVLFEVLTIYLPFYAFLAFSSFKLKLNTENNE